MLSVGDTIIDTKNDFNQRIKIREIACWGIEGTDSHLNGYTMTWDYAEEYAKDMANNPVVNPYKYAGLAPGEIFSVSDEDIAKWEAAIECTIL